MDTESSIEFVHVFLVFSLWNAYFNFEQLQNGSAPIVQYVFLQEK